MGAYGYSRPTSVDEMISILESHAKKGERTQILAGGTDVIVQMRSVDREPRMLVDVKHIAETNKLEIGKENVFIGAAIPSALLNANEELKAIFPGVIEAADLIGSTQIQGRASIGGNLCNSSPAGDSIPALIAAGGVCVIASSNGEKRIAVEEFVTGVGTNVLGEAEFLLGLEFKNPGSNSGDAYLRFIPRTEMDIAVAGAGVALALDDNGTCTQARVAIGAVAITALLVDAAGDALIGTKVDDDALAAAGAACTEAASPISDKRGTVEFRNKVVGVLCRRAGSIARDRALANA